MFNIMKLCRLNALALGISIPSLSDYRIQGIMTRSLPESEEFSEVQSGYFASKVKFTSDKPMNKHMVYTVSVFQQ